MTTQNQKLIAFAQAVGTDYKSLKELFTQLQRTVTQLPQSSAVTNEIEQKIRELKNELLGGQDLDAQLDTLKEIGDKLKELKNDNSLSQAITQKLTEINQKITALEQYKTGLEGLDLVATYQAAKNG